MTVITRFAPSPTGLLHIGGIRTALFSWLYARRHSGKFILRIEDTDRERSTDDAKQVILDAISWLGLDYDEGPYYQTQRFDRYTEIIQQLLEVGHAYRCACAWERLEQLRNDAMLRGEKPRYDGHCRSLDLTDRNTVVRFKTPVEGNVIVDDLVQKKVSYANSELDDLIIARSDGTPTYNLTVVVDDMDMQITHVIRGDDHLNNTPRQINILTALGATLPKYAHIPMILGPDGRKLSKRTDATSILQYRESGYLPDALLNYLARLGWSYGDQEIFSREEMIGLFDISDVNQSAASLNPKKLIWLNQYYLKNTDSTELVSPLNKLLTLMDIQLESGPDLISLIDVQKQRTETLLDMARQSIFFYEDFEEYDPSLARKHLKPVVLDPLIALHKVLATLVDWDNENIKMIIEQIAKQFGLTMGKVAQPLRVAVTGTGISPSIDDTLRLLGQEKCLTRLSKSIAFIKAHSRS